MIHLINDRRLAAEDANLPLSINKLAMTSELSQALGTGRIPSSGKLHKGFSHVAVQVKPAFL